MDNQMLLNMFSSMIDKMNDDELNKTLQQAKALLSPQDYEKLKQVISEKRKM